jgi:hypothetical protein
METYMTDALRRMEESFERRLAEMESTISRLSLQQACLVHSLPLALQPQNAAQLPPRSLQLQARLEQQPIDHTNEAHDDSDDDNATTESDPTQAEENAFSTAFEERDYSQGSPPTAVPATMSDKLVLNVGGRVFHTLRYQPIVCARVPMSA